MRSAFLFAIATLALAGCTCAPGPVEPPAPECTSVDGCGENRACIAGACVDAPDCLAIDDWPRCQEFFNAEEPGLGRTAVCRRDAEGSPVHHCAVACEADDQCLPGSLCTDFGECVAGLRRAPAGAALGAHAALLAGAGEAVLDVPATVSLGGLSARGGSGDNAWADGMDAAVGRLEGQLVKAISLDAGDGRALFISLPIIFPTGALSEAIAQRLEDATGEDWRDALVVTATHTHSGPARFLPLLGDSEAVLGPFGIGTFRQEVFDRMADSAAKAALAAIDGAVPARLAATIVEAFDTDDALAHDRRNESPDFDDNRALLVRIDDDAGVPLAVLTGFGVHPTENSSNWATGDVTGGVERGLEEALFAVAGRVVPVMFVNGAGGSMAPSAGGRGFAVPHGNAYTGATYAARVMPTLLALETKPDVAVRARAHRFHTTTTTLGYGPAEWVNPGLPPFGGEVTYGGLNCFSVRLDDGDAPFSDHLAREDMACGIPFHTFLFNHPPTVFQRTQISALAIDGLALLTMPGELTMELGWGIAAELERTQGIDPLTHFAIGYSADHLMYLLPTTLDEASPPWPGFSGEAPNTFPPFAFSPLRGGFEADTSVFGDLLGQAMVREAMVAWERLSEGAPAAEEIAPPVYSTNVKAPCAVRPPRAAPAGLLLTPLPAAVARRAPVELTFVGGDVAVEGQGPEVTLLDGAGAPVLLKSGRPFSTTHALLPQRAALVDGEWHYTVRLELPFDHPTGPHALQVRGTHLVAGQAQAYTTTTATFTVTPATLAVSATREGAALRVVVGHATEEPGLEDEALTGRLWLVDHRVPTGRLAPLRVGDLAAAGVVLTPDGGAAVTADAVTEALDGEVPTTVATVATAPTAALTVVVTDALGNTGTATVPAAD